MSGRHVIKPGQTHHPQKFFRAHARVTYDDVMAQGAVKQTAVLPDVAHRGAPVRGIYLGCIHTINEKLSAALLVQASHDAQQGRLTAADFAQNGHLLPGFDVDIDVVQNAWRHHHSRYRVGEPHLFQTQAAGEIGGRQIIDERVALGRRFHQLVQGFQRGFGVLITQRQPDHRSQGRKRTAGQDHHPNHGPHRQFPGVD